MPYWFGDSVKTEERLRPLIRRRLEIRERERLRLCQLDWDMRLRYIIKKLISNCDRWILLLVLI